MPNNFTHDANCVALWKFDNDANDSKGGNNLTEINTPTYDAATKKEGTHAIDFERGSNEYCTITDGNLDANFPGKNGTGEQSFSICAWVRLESLASDYGQYLSIVAKYESGLRSYVITLNPNDDKVNLTIGYNAGANYTSDGFGTACVINRWYHIAITYNAADNGMKIRIWDDTAGALLDANATETAGGNMSPDTAPLEIGRYWGSDTRCLDGKMDEVVMFKSALSDADIDAIRNGVYGFIPTVIMI